MLRQLGTNCSVTLQNAVPFLSLFLSCTCVASLWGTRCAVTPCRFILSATCFVVSLTPSSSNRPLGRTRRKMVRRQLRWRGRSTCSLSWGKAGKPLSKSSSTSGMTEISCRCTSLGTDCSDPGFTRCGVSLPTCQNATNPTLVFFIYHIWPYFVGSYSTVPVILGVCCWQI